MNIISAPGFADGVQGLMNVSDEMDQEFDATGKIPSHLIVNSPIDGIVVRKDIFPGGYVNAGDRPYTIADLSTLWLQAKIYERDVLQDVTWTP